ncbi:dual oxidase maturation factor 1-like [Haliotis cracherodii]|uniref:dual oxidase maturation factor 1-like n=1 Tax=Haliotis cracherodii TaxID=6455 RepID=UPI0039ECCD97
MAWFGAFRNSHGFSWYEDNPTAATVDIPLAAVTYFCILVSVATLIASLGIRGKDRWITALRAIYGLAVGSIILVGAYSHSWQTGTLQVTTPYVYRSPQQFQGVVGVHVALHGANVTLIGQFGSSPHSGHVAYSESLPWSDFGHESDAFHDFVGRGLPDPILRVVEHLCADAGGLRWGKAFHTAGDFACALLWTAFAFWIVTNILLFSVICYGGYMFVLTGFTMSLTCLVYHVCQPSNSLVISYGEHILRTYYDWSFWLILVTGLATFVLGLLIVFLDHIFPKKMAEVMGVDAGIEDDRGEFGAFASLRDRKESIFFTQDRRGSIFQDRERRSSLYPGAERRTSVFGDQQRRGSFCGMAWYSNKGFTSADEKTRVNPLFTGRNSITEEDEILPAKTQTEVQINIEDEEGNITSGADRKSSCSSAKEDRDNDLNEKQASSSVTLEIGRLSRQLSHDSGNESGCVQTRDFDSTSSSDACAECSQSLDSNTS